MVQFIPLALKAAGMFLPSLIDRIAGDKAGKVAGQVLQTVENVTGTKIKTEADLSIAKDMVDKNPELAAQLQSELVNLQVITVQEAGSTLRAALEADTNSPHTTRPYIARHSFNLVALISLIIVSMWAYGVGSDNEKLVTAVVDGWPFVLAVVAPFVTLLRAYFGVLKVEHQNRLAAAGGQVAPTGIAAVLSTLIGGGRAR